MWAWCTKRPDAVCSLPCALVPGTVHPLTGAISSPKCATGGTRVGSVMLNFMFQSDQVMGCPDIWSSIILGSSRVFLGKMNIRIGKAIKQSPSLKGVSPTQSIEGQKRTKRLTFQEQEGLPPAPPPGAGTVVLSSLQTPAKTSALTES